MNEYELIACSNIFYSGKTQRERDEIYLYILENIENLTDEEKRNFYVTMQGMLGCGLIYRKFRFKEGENNYALTELGKDYAPKLRLMLKKRRKWW